MNRVLAVAFILFCFEIGVVLVFVPWSALWENNVLLTYSISLRGLLLNNFVRGAVSGLGVVDLALGLGELKLSGQVLPTMKKVVYGLDIKRVMRSKLVLGIADGWLSADGSVIYRAKDLKVGLFRQDAMMQPSGA